MSDFTRGILVKKDGLYYRDWEDGEQQERKVDSFVSYLNEELQVEGDITFEDFFNHVMDDYEMVSVVFAGQLGHYDLGNWREEWACPFVSKSDGHTRTKHLEVEWSAEWWDRGMDREIEEWVGFGGRGDTLDESTGEWIKDMGISFSFSPINEMKNYPFKINTEYKMFDWEKYRTNKKTKDYDKCLAVNGTKRMTVYNVIGGILDDISFYGEPDHRDEKSEELSSRCDEFETLIDEKGIDGAIADGDLMVWDPDSGELKRKLSGDDGSSGTSGTSGTSGSGDKSEDSE